MVTGFANWIAQTIPFKGPLEETLGTQPGRGKVATLLEPAGVTYCPFVIWKARKGAPTIPQ